MIDLSLLKNFFPIEGERITLSVFREENITEAYLGWLNDPVVVRFSDQRFRKHTQQTSLNYLNSFIDTENFFFAIYLKDDKRYVGTMSVYFSSAHETADIGIMIGNKACWRQGIASDAWITLLSFLLDMVKVRKITGGTLSGNTAMINIMINSGMELDGVRVAQELVDGQVQDVVHFAKFRGD